MTTPKKKNSTTGKISFKSSKIVLYLCLVKSIHVHRLPATTLSLTRNVLNDFPFKTSRKVGEKKEILSDTVTTSKELQRSRMKNFSSLFNLLWSHTTNTSHTHFWNLAFPDSDLDLRFYHDHHPHSSDPPSTHPLSAARDSRTLDSTSQCGMSRCQFRRRRRCCHCQPTMNCCQRAGPWIWRTFNSQMSRSRWFDLQKFGPLFINNKILTWSRPKLRHLGGANAEGSERFDGNGLTNAPPLPKGLEADETAGLRWWLNRCGWKRCVP